MQGLTIWAPFLGIIGLIVAYLIYNYIKKQPNGNPLMQELEGMIHSGAMAFLKKEYSVLTIFIIIVFIDEYDEGTYIGCEKRKILVG